MMTLRSAVTFLILGILITSASIAQDEPVDIVVDGRYSFTYEDNPVDVPFLTSHALDEIHPGLDRAVIILPEEDRELSAPYQDLQDAADAEGVTNTTLLAGLQFLILADILEYDLVDTNIPYWDGTWIIGNESQSSPDAPRDAILSTFSVIDSLVYRISEQCPDLQTIVITGGGNSVQRYTAGTAIPFELEDQIDVLFVPFSASSFVYLSDERPNFDGEFTALDGAYLDAVPDYNIYPFGLDELNPYMGQHTLTWIRSMYSAKYVSYIVGENDTDWDLHQSRNIIQGYFPTMQHILWAGYLDLNSIPHSVQSVHIIPDHNHDTLLLDQDVRKIVFFYEPTTKVDETYNDDTIAPLTSILQNINIKPNPFNPATAVTFVLKHPARVRVRVFNIQGRSVMTLHDGHLQPGQHKMQVDGSNLASGTYFVNLEVPGESSVFQKLSLVK